MRRPPPPKHVCRGVPPEAETALSAPLKVPPPAPKKNLGAASGAARVDAGAKNTFQVVISFRPCGAACGANITVRTTAPLHQAQAKC